MIDNVKIYTNILWLRVPFALNLFENIRSHQVKLVNCSYRVPNIVPSGVNDCGQCVERLLLVGGASLDWPRFQSIQCICLHHRFEIDLVANASDADIASGSTFGVVRLDDSMRSLVVKVPA